MTKLTDKEKSIICFELEDRIVVYQNEKGADNTAIIAELEAIIEKLEQ
jgi:hypothetical protein